jgi:hypothetical protein
VRILAISTLATALLVSTPHAQAKVGVMSLPDLVSGSDLIVVAEVVAVDPAELPGERTARGTVLDTWKGQPGASVTFSVSPTWPCHRRRAGSPLPRSRHPRWIRRLSDCALRAWAAAAAAGQRRLAAVAQPCDLRRRIPTEMEYPGRDYGHSCRTPVSRGTNSGLFANATELSRAPERSPRDFDHL